jgi:peptide/nickel transport system ATP-binding protein
LTEVGLKTGSLAAEPLVRARNLEVSFQIEHATIRALNGVDFDLAPRETLCILGESGSGKSVLLRSLMRLNPPRRTTVTGSLRVCGHDIQTAPERQLTELRGSKVAMIFQEPLTAFDPVFTIGRQIAETTMRHDKLSRADADCRAMELLELVQIPLAKQRLAMYPFELSGGLRQRAMIAMALSCRPKLLLADEPTTALDATVQIQILVLLRRLQQELGMGMILVTHDIGVASEIADRVAVMYAGRIVEEGPIGAFIADPLHPYSRGLLGATVQAAEGGERLKAIAGAPPDLARLPHGCSFAPRCERVVDTCLIDVPTLRSPASGRSARCVHVGAVNNAGSSP